jgi:hypothetical protein
MTLGLDTGSVGRERLLDQWGSAWQTREMGMGAPDFPDFLVNFPSPGLYQCDLNSKDKRLYAKLVYQPSIVLPYIVFIVVSIIFVILA